MEPMRKHWRTIHQWSQQAHHGRVGPKEKARGEAELQQSFQYVSWQQVFPSGLGSHYIHIHYPTGVEKSNNDCSRVYLRRSAD
jgi:hypothetical protein